MGKSANIGEEMLKDAILIAGPTASGKSQLAIAFARALGGIIVNADSMQVYSVLSLVTARPDADDLSAASHYLYGHVHPGEAYSTGRWLEDVSRLKAEGLFDGRCPIFVGGTGLYFRALTEGLSPMPDIPADIRAVWRERLAGEGAEALHHLLQARDPASAESIRPGDGQRIVRALEVLSASGRPISAWQAEAPQPLVDRADCRLFVLEPERHLLRQRINARFERMVEEGALDEVKALLALELDPRQPAMKAIGVRELAAFIEGRVALEEAVERAKAATRQYAKRQTTWFRHQLNSEWEHVPLGEGEDVALLLARLLGSRTNNPC